MQQRIMTADCFYNNPYSVRKEALTAKYINNVSEEPFFHKEAMEKLCHMVQNNLEILNTDNSGKFLCQDKNFSTQNVTAHLSADWVAIVYLSLPNHCQGKTALEICTHKNTGLEYIPTETCALMSGYSCYEEIQEGLLQTDAADPNSWSAWFTVFEKYNRIVIIDAKLWHRQLKGYGDTINNCRLSQLFYLRNR